MRPFLVRIGMLVTNGKLNKVIIARGKDIMGRFLRWWFGVKGVDDEL